MTTQSNPLRRVLELGPAAQSIVAGVYAWTVTVAPVGYGKHGGAQNWPATIFATLAFLALVRGAVAEIVLAGKEGASSRLEQSRTLTLFSFCAMSVITWIFDDGALTPVHLGAARGVAGMLGWALFAYACSAPVIEPVEEPARVEAGARARGRVSRGDVFFVAGGAILALSLQLIGWNVASPERAILVRVTTLGAAVLLLGGVGAYVSTRHGERNPNPNPHARVRVRAQRPLPLGWVVALLLLVTAGILYVLTE